jgi:outer membrane protein assembly factor BamB
MKKTILIFLLILISLSVGACSGRRIIASGWSEITLKDDIIYFPLGPRVHALNLKDGSQIWQYPLEDENGAGFYAAPVLANQDKQLILASYDSNLYSLDPDSGQKMWTFEEASNRYIASPLVTADMIYAPSSDNNLYAVDFNGNGQWVFETEKPIWATPAWSENCQCIYLASMDRTLYAIDPEDGSLLWKSEDLEGPVVSQPAVSDTGLILVSSFANEIIALDETSHQIAWRFPTADWAWAKPVIDGEQVYASDLSGTIYAIDLDSGDPLWQLQPGGEIVAAPLLVDDQIYFSTASSSLVVVSKEGVIQRNQPIDGTLYSSPVSDGDTILLAPTEAEFYLLALNQNLVQIWGFPPSEDK